MAITLSEKGEKVCMAGVLVYMVGSDGGKRL